jgi:hypothetical protein
MNRLQISEMLRPAVDVALEALQRHLEARAFPLTPKSQKIFELTQSLMLEFAGSYQVATLDMMTKKEGNKKALQLAIYRALDLMGKVLLLTYTVYVRTRETLWHDIHHLYLLAVENGVEKVGLRDASPGAPTIEMRYVQMNLLALVKPYCLRQGEATRLMQYFVKNTALVTIARDAEGQQTGEYVHAVMLNSDEPAVMMLLSDLPHSPTVRVLNLNTLVARVDVHIRELEAKGVPAMLLQDLSRNLAKRVIYHLSAVRNRSYNRFPKKEHIGMVTRFPDVFTVIRDAQKTEASEDAEAEDMLFNVFMSSDSYEDEDRAKPAVIHRVAEEEGARIQTWKVLNTSVGGYGLCWADKEASGARVGEIVALRDTPDPSAVWMIGVIKWMEFVVGKGLCCGVELLSTKIMVVSVKGVINRTVTQKMPVDGLMLPSIEGIRPDPALILPAYIFQVNDEIRLEFAERDERVRLVLLDECLGAFAYFRFTTLADKSQEEDEDDFTSLWQSL